MGSANRHEKLSFKITRLLRLKALLTGPKHFAPQTAINS